MPGYWIAHLTYPAEAILTLSATSPRHDHAQAEQAHHPNRTPQPSPAMQKRQRAAQASGAVQLSQLGSSGALLPDDSGDVDLAGLNRCALSSLPLKAAARGRAFIGCGFYALKLIVGDERQGEASDRQEFVRRECCFRHFRAFFFGAA